MWHRVWLRPPACDRSGHSTFRGVCAPLQAHLSCSIGLRIHTCQQGTHSARSAKASAAEKSMASKPLQGYKRSTRQNTANTSKTSQIQIVQVVQALSGQAARQALSGQAARHLHSTNVTLEPGMAELPVPTVGQRAPQPGRYGGGVAGCQVWWVAERPVAACPGGSQF